MRRLGSSAIDIAFSLPMKLSRFFRVVFPMFSNFEASILRSLIFEEDSLSIDMASLSIFPSLFCNQVPLAWIEPLLYSIHISPSILSGSIDRPNMQILGFLVFLLMSKPDEEPL
ncbi:hypothetical protein AYI70_g7877 [Smittium culicis]|uniref:Uncharacterized protein n=1 Tax=Smittium culicis TaxID=133412 RepID=A0A1R1XIG7_9FUNG|nr:hypothetical protein AYI70_g7877 [Smittium culicis]